LNRSRGGTVAEQTIVASRPWTRLRGLLFRAPLGPKEGLLILPCQGVHTFGMRYPIDVVYVDRQGVVCRVLRGLQPGRLGPFVLRSHFVLELSAGAATASEGDLLSFEPLEERAQTRP
jgi:uncharacterized membrane protein (UPF0127 family)